VEIDGETEVLAKVTSEHHGAPANTPITVRWDQKPGKVVRVVLKPTCTNGIFREQHFFPWKYDVEHEEVNFSSGSDAIPDVDKPKLDKSLGAVKKALAQYSRWGKPNLYIAGHTDTVASTDFNRDLSNRRARSIARYFRQKGLNVDIFYIGFGEEAPVVPTADEVNEPRNRRAEYIISVDAPEVRIAGFNGSWSKL
jgi:outer membrane protein OmpA-like peptidoglycan-associated protein